LTDKGNVHIVKITKQPESVDEALAAAEVVKKVAGKVDVVIANAGIIGHETSIADSPMDMFQQFLDVNLLNNIAIFKALRPLMLESVQQGGTPKFVAISTQYGSLAMVEDLPGQSSAYAISKAALNMFIRHLAYEEKKNGIVAFPIHPGVVATETVAPLARRIGLGTIEPAESIEGMMKIVDRMTVEDELHLWKYDDTQLPW
jgi:NAD(P)-dependent dehydrogenase (short-subunit alcohol dehydrogenase family)